MEEHYSLFDLKFVGNPPVKDKVICVVAKDFEEAGQLGAKWFENDTHWREYSGMIVSRSKRFEEDTNEVE